jgi:uncharacterized protein YjiS (DUF1127 family)
MAVDTDIEGTTMASDRKLRRFIRAWRRRYPYPVPWVDDRANKQCRRSEEQWLGQFDGSSMVKRKDLLALVLWKVGGQDDRLEQAFQGVTGPANLGHAKRCIRKALATSNAMTALEGLVGETGGIPHWDPSMSSVVLAVCRPKVYAIADERALRTLAVLNLYSPAVDGRFRSVDWVPYLRACRRLAELSAVSLRDVSRALWAAADDAPNLPKTAPKPGR